MRRTNARSSVHAGLPEKEKGQEPGSCPFFEQLFQLKTQANSFRRTNARPARARPRSATPVPLSGTLETVPEKEFDNCCVRRSCSECGVENWKLSVLMAVPFCVRFSRSGLVPP